MKFGEYLSSARMYTIVMLVAVYLGLDLARFYSQRVGLLVEARRSFAEEYVRQNYKDTPLDHKVPGVGHLKVHENVTSEGASRRIIPGVAVQTVDERKVSFTVERADRRRWTVELKDKGRKGPALGERPAVVGNRELTESEFVSSLKRIALDIGLTKTEKQEYTQLFRDIERALVDQEVKIPGLELAFRTDLAPWIIAFLTVGLMLLIRNQLRRVFLDQTLAIDKPWLILDGERGLEKLVAGVWLLAIFLAPWVASSSVLMVYTGRIIADGAITTPFKDALVSVTILLLVGVSGWASLTVVSDLLRLRRMRQEKLADLIASGTRKSDGEEAV